MMLAAIAFVSQLILVLLPGLVVHRALAAGMQRWRFAGRYEADKPDHGGLSKRSIPGPNRAIDRICSRLGLG